MKNNNFFRSLSILLVGMIIGFLINKIPSLSVPSTVTLTSTPTETQQSIKTMGNPDAKVTITEYSDFQCPFCFDYFSKTYPKILKNYVETGKVKYQFKNMPLNMHPQAPGAALAAECALEQNKFWEMHDALFTNQSKWSGQSDYLNTFSQLAAALGLKQDQFNTCLNSSKYQGSVKADYSEGLSRGFGGTPSFVINDQILIGSQDYSVFAETIDKLLQ
jgi:protein-disulfide isomerase